jgi:hypothetical protein
MADGYVVDETKAKANGGGRAAGSRVACDGCGPCRAHTRYITSIVNADVDDGRAGLYMMCVEFEDSGDGSKVPMEWNFKC